MSISQRVDCLVYACQVLPKRNDEKFCDVHRNRIKLARSWQGQGPWLLTASDYEGYDKGHDGLGRCGITQSIGAGFRCVNLGQAAERETTVGPHYVDNIGDLCSNADCGGNLYAVDLAFGRLATVWKRQDVIVDDKRAEAGVVFLSCWLLRVSHPPGVHTEPYENTEEGDYGIDPPIATTIWEGEFPHQLLDCAEVSSHHLPAGLSEVEVAPIDVFLVNLGEAAVVSIYTTTIEELSRMQDKCSYKIATSTGVVHRLVGSNIDCVLPPCQLACALGPRELACVDQALAVTVARVDDIARTEHSAEAFSPLPPFSARGEIGVEERPAALEASPSGDCVVLLSVDESRRRWHLRAWRCTVDGKWEAKWMRATSDSLDAVARAACVGRLGPDKRAFVDHTLAAQSFALGVSATLVTIARSSVIGDFVPHVAVLCARTGAPMRTLAIDGLQPRGAFVRAGADVSVDGRMRLWAVDTLENSPPHKQKLSDQASVMARCFEAARVPAHCACGNPCVLRNTCGSGVDGVGSAMTGYSYLRCNKTLPNREPRCGFRETVDALGVAWWDDSAGGGAEGAAHTKLAAPFSLFRR